MYFAFILVQKYDLYQYDATRLRQLYTGFRFNTPFISERIHVDIWKPIYTINTGTLAVQGRLRLVWQLLLLFCSLLGVAEQGITYSLNKNSILIVGKLSQGRSQLRSPAQQMYEYTVSIPTHSYHGRILRQARLKPFLPFSPLSRRSWHRFFNI